MAFRIRVARAIAYPANFAGSQGGALVASTGTATFDIQKNDVSMGTMVFTSDDEATFTTTSGTAKSLAPGDYLSVIAPASPDATLADIGFTLFGDR
jgi:hypothetical protein